MTTDIPDLIAGALGVSRGTAYDMMREALAEQPAQQEPVAEVKAKMTGGNVGIATVIHEIHSPLREPLQPGDKLYAAYRWIGWDVEQVWSERIFGIDMRFENVQDAIAFREKLDEATTPQAQPAPVQYQRREIGEGDWEDCTKEQYEKAMALPEWDTRVITAPQAQPSAVATLAPEPDQQAAAVMPCGAVVSNVYEAYEAGKKAQPAREPVKLSGYELDGRRYKTMEERLKDAFYEGFTSSATYNDIELNDVDEEWLKYATAHGITKGNT